MVFGFNDYEFSSDEIENIKIEDESKINVLVTHGTLNGASKKYLDLKEKILNKFDYVALGHIHERKVDDSKIIYPGSLLSIGFDELGEHGIVIGELEKGNITYEFRNMEYRHFEIVEVDISNFKAPEEILNHVELGENIYRIVLKGERNIDTQKVKDIINLQGKNICEIRDLTHISYDFELIAKEKNIKGFFTKKMLEEMEEHPERKEEILKAIEITYQLL